MARYTRTIIMTQSGQKEKCFPLLCLPAEIRNMVYRESLLKEDYIPTLSQPALLRTCRQIRDESLAMYYSQNKFLIYFAAVGGQTLGNVHKFVNGRQATMETHVRHIKFSISHKVIYLGSHDEHLQHVFRSMPYGFIFPFFPSGRMGKPKAECADYSVAKKEFSDKLKEECMLHPDFTGVINDCVYNEELLPPVLELFEAVWPLAHTFPEADKSIFTVSRLPVEPRSHIW